MIKRVEYISTAPVVVDTVEFLAEEETAVDTIGFITEEPNSTITPSVRLVRERRIFRGVYVTALNDSLFVTFHLTQEPYFSFSAVLHPRDSVKVVMHDVLVPDLETDFISYGVIVFFTAIITLLVKQYREKKKNAPPIS